MKKKKTSKLSIDQEKLKAWFDKAIREEDIYKIRKTTDPSLSIYAEPWQTPLDVQNKDPEQGDINRAITQMKKEIGLPLSEFEESIEKLLKDLMVDPIPFDKNLIHLAALTEFIKTFSGTK
jgi:hypothetical protein